jgi:hypothetical protein
MKLKSCGETMVQGKKVYTIDLVANGVPRTRAEWMPLLMGKVVQIDDKFHVVHGIESVKPAEPYQHEKLGLMVTMQAPKYVRENTLP